MVVLSTERCTGCGACVEVCPAGALYLVDGRVALDDTLCRDCEACVAACPAGALAVRERAPAAVARAVVPAAAARAVVPGAERSAVTVRAAAMRVLPAAGAALAWVAREIVPRLADYWLDSLDRPRSGQRAGRCAPAGSPLRGGPGAGGRRRHRQRGGRA